METIPNNSVTENLINSADLDDDDKKYDDEDDKEENDKFLEKTSQMPKQNLNENIDSKIFL